jgi:hypothetical protein
VGVDVSIYLEVRLDGGWKLVQFSLDGMPSEGDEPRPVWYGPYHPFEDFMESRDVCFCYRDDVTGILSPELEAYFGGRVSFSFFAWADYLKYCKERLEEFEQRLEKSESYPMKAQLDRIESTLRRLVKEPVSGLSECEDCPVSPVEVWEGFLDGCYGLFGLKMVVGWILSKFDAEFDSKDVRLVCWIC